MNVNTYMYVYGFHSKYFFKNWNFNMENIQTSMGIEWLLGIIKVTEETKVLSGTDTHTW